MTKQQRINGNRFASAVMIHLLNKRNYHIYLWHQYDGYYDSYYDYPWHWNNYIKINTNIELRNIHAKTHKYLFGTYCKLSFELYINDELIRKYRAVLPLNQTKDDFGCWEVENTYKRNKAIPQWAVYQIFQWIEKMRAKRD